MPWQHLTCIIKHFKKFCSRLPSSISMVLSAGMNTVFFSFLHHRTLISDGSSVSNMNRCGLESPNKAVQQGQPSPSDTFNKMKEQKEERKDKRKESEREREREQTTAASSISHYIEYSV